MSKVRAICHLKALILTIPMYCVKKSNPGKARENELFVVYVVTIFYIAISCAKRVDFPQRNIYIKNI